MLIVGIGGTTRPGSTSEEALRVALGAAAGDGAQTLCFGGSDLLLPLYEAQAPERTEAALRMVAALRVADGVIIASPGYHGSISGLVKNALDYCEDLRSDDRPYLQGRLVGCIAVASGWQAAVNTLRVLRDVAHALRGMPTPYGAAINSAIGQVGRPPGLTTEDREWLSVVGVECVRFAQMDTAKGSGAAPGGSSHPLDTAQNLHEPRHVEIR
jgi:FMN reductase